MARTCERCGKIQKSNTGFERHRVMCESRPRKLPRLEYLTEQQWPEAANASPPQVNSLVATLVNGSQKHNHFSSIGHEDQEDTTGGIDEVDCDKISESESPVKEHDTESQSNSDLLENAAPSEKSLANDEISLTYRHGLLSTSSGSLQVQTFEDITARQAGAGFQADECPVVSLDSEMSAENPFQSRFDYFFATWLRSSGISKGNVDRLLKDARVGPLAQHLSFQNSTEWHEKVEALSHGMKPDWKLTYLTIESQFTGQKEQESFIIYQNILEAIKFLLSHKPFERNLVYGPIRVRDAMGHRIYNEMNTGDWWWETQNALPDKATVVPLLLATDKTLLTQHHGDTTAWPVYLTIGNLDRSTRRSQKRPGQVLLGFLPVVSNKDEGVKAEVWHKAMGIILEQNLAIEKAARSGIAVLCADDVTRMCYPVIASFAADYEEQVIITGVKSGRHCTICTVPSDERDKLQLKSAPRTHQSTQEQLLKQNQLNIKKSDEEWVHPVENFAWKHAHVNIHQAMTLDPLHQLLKGVFKHLMGWLESEINVTVKAVRKKTGTKLDIAQANAVAKLDERFRRVQRCQNLHVFQAFSQVQQWTGNEDKSLVKQIIPVFVPLLLPKSPHLLQLARAIVDFIILASYVSHSDETLRYLEHALFRIDIWKRAASKFRPNGRFNFPKFHIMSHYPDFIRRYGAADNFDTEHGEASHKVHVKAFYSLTNKHTTYLQQIVKHSIRRLNSIASEDIELYKKTALSSITREQMGACATTPAREVPLKEISGLPLRKEESKVVDARLNPAMWCTTLALANCAKIPGLLTSLAVFVRRQREERSGLTPQNWTGDRVEEHTSWIESFLICVHPSLKCWSRTGKCSQDLEQLEPHFVRCKPNWQNTGMWRRDWVWVQETLEAEGLSNVLSGKLPGQLKIIVTVQDPERVIPGTYKPQCYTGALVEVLRPRYDGQVNEVHGMVEVERRPERAGEDRRTLGSTRFYPLSTVLRSVHLVSTSLTEEKRFFVNNYLDWDTFNTLYDPDWEEKASRAALNFEKRW